MEALGFYHDLLWYLSLILRHSHDTKLDLKNHAGRSKFAYLLLAYHLKLHIQKEHMNVFGC